MFSVFLLATFVLNLISILLIERFESYLWNKNLAYGIFCRTRHSKAFWSQLQNSWIVAFHLFLTFLGFLAVVFSSLRILFSHFLRNFWHHYSSYWFIIIFKYVIQSWVILTRFIYRTLLSYLLKKKNYISLILLFKYFLFLNTLSDLFPTVSSAISFCPFSCYIFPSFISFFILFLKKLFFSIVSHIKFIISCFYFNFNFYITIYFTFHNFQFFNFYFKSKAI